MILRRIAGGMLAAALAAAGAGCSDGSNLVKVRGTVTLDGQPVSGANITLVSPGERPERHNGISGADGSFEVSAPPGEYNVLVVQMVPVDGAAPKPDASRSTPTWPIRPRRPRSSAFTRPSTSCKFRIS